VGEGGVEIGIIHSLQQLAGRATDGQRRQALLGVSAVLLEMLADECFQ
jgi:hypothetical protein